MGPAPGPRRAAPEDLRPSPAIPPTPPTRPSSWPTPEPGRPDRPSPPGRSPEVLRASKPDLPLCVTSVALNIAMLGYLSYSGGIRRVFIRMNLLDVSLDRAEFQLQNEDRFRKLPSRPGEVVFAGDSLIAAGPWPDFYTTIHTRGIGGETTLGLLQRLDEITEDKPRKLVPLDRLQRPVRRRAARPDPRQLPDHPRAGPGREPVDRDGRDRPPSGQQDDPRRRAVLQQHRGPGGQPPAQGPGRRVPQGPLRGHDRPPSRRVGQPPPRLHAPTGST